MRNIIATVRGRSFTLKCKFFRKNIHVGEGLKIYGKLEIKGKGKVFIGKNCIVSGIRGDENQFVTLYTHGPQAILSIGDNANLYAARFSSKFGISIGKDVLIEESGIADTDFHSIDKSRGSPPNEDKENCQIIIGNRVSIGARSLINKGVAIGDDVIIAPGSVVSKSIPSNSFVLGNPARISRHRQYS